MRTKPPEIPHPPLTGSWPRALTGSIWTTPIPALTATGTPSMNTGGFTEESRNNNANDVKVKSDITDFSALCAPTILI